MGNALQERLEQQLYEKVKVEYDAHLAEIKTKPVDEIISNAYEIAWRENLLYLFDSSTGLTEKRLQVLLEMQSPCAEMYAGWLKQDSEELDAIRGCMENCADNIMGNRVRKPMLVTNWRNGEQTTGAAWSVQGYSKRKAEQPTMSRPFPLSCKNGKQILAKNAVCLCWLAPCSSVLATNGSICQRGKQRQNSRNIWSEQAIA